MKGLKNMQPVANKADLPLVTFDNNALIALRREEPEAVAVHELLEMNRAGQIIVNINASTALEAQRPDDQLEGQDHIAWLMSLGIAKEYIFTGPNTIGFATPGEPNTIMYDGRREMELNMKIHAILFRNVPFSWYEYRDRECVRDELSPKALAEYDFAQMESYPPTPLHPLQPPMPTYEALRPEEQERIRVAHTKYQRAWYNAKNDALGLYNHLTLVWHTNRREHAVFVTNDRNFIKQAKVTALRRLGFMGKILAPPEAVAFLKDVLNTR